MLYRKYLQISLSKMLNQATSLGISTNASRFCTAPCPNLRQSHYLSSNYTIGRPVQVDSHLNSSLVNRPSGCRLFTSSRVVHSKAVSACEDLSSEKKPATRRTRKPSSCPAQKDLCDYFYGTRGYAFSDADFISKNAPIFLESLVSKLHRKGSFEQSISRLLRYHPINEFEPFFESMGLPPIKYNHLLPKDLIYLSDEPSLLENYHVLCNYGVPRAQIGRIYLESEEVFRYGEGVLISKLRNYEKMGLCRVAIVKLITCCPNILVGEVDSDIRRVYEKLSSLGVEFDLVIHCLSHKSKYNWGRVSEMLTFLDSMGFDKLALATLIKETPIFVFHESGKNIYLLVAILIKVGLKTDGILNLFTKNPHILIGNFVKNLGQSVRFLAEIGMEPGDITRTISSNPQIFGSSPCRSSDSVLYRLRLSPKSLSDIIKADPTKFTSLACARNVADPVHRNEEIFVKEKTEFLLKLGFADCSDEMAKVASLYRGRGDKLQERFDCLVNYGIDYHDAANMIKMAPAVLNQTADVINEKIDYLITQLGYPLESLIDFPSFLCYKMDRVRLRFEMVRWLSEEKGVAPTTPKRNKRIGERFALSTVLATSEKRFMKYFVDNDPEKRKHYEMLKKSILTSPGIAN